MKLFEKGELKLLWPFYLSNLIESIFLIWMVFYIIYFKQMGLTFFQISSFLAVYSFLVIIFEVPTGAIADIFGRKFSVVLGLIFSGFLFILIALFKDYYTLLGLWAFLGITTTLMSGADQALVIEHLNRNKRKDLIYDYYIKDGSIMGAGLIFSGIIGAFLVKYFGLEIIWWSGGASMIFGAFFIFSFVDEGFKRKKIKIIEQIKETWTYSKFSISYGIKNKVLLFIILAGFFTVISTSLSSMIAWQPLLVNLGFEVYWLGYFMSLSGLIMVFVPFLSKPLLKTIKSEKNYLAILLSTLFLITLFIIIVPNWEVAVLIFCLMIIPFELIHPVRSKFSQHHTPSKYRASITSSMTMIMGIGGTIGALVAGYLMDIIGPKMTIFFSAFFLIPAIIFYLMIKEK